jgi:hypothetical protein
MGKAARWQKPGRRPDATTKGQQMKEVLLLCICMTAGTSGTICMAGETTFVIGARPWNFQPRSRENHLSLQMSGPDALRRGPMENGGGMGAGHPGFPIISNSYAIGNWIQVDMLLGDGSEGLIMIENHQTNNGDQQSVSDVMGDLIKAYQE